MPILRRFALDGSNRDFLDLPRHSRNGRSNGLNTRFEKDVAIGDGLVIWRNCHFGFDRGGVFDWSQGRKLAFRMRMCRRL